MGEFQFNSQDNGFYEALFDLSDNMIIMTDLNGKIIYANKLVAKKLGYSEKELKKMNIYDLHPNELKDKVSENLQNLIAGKEKVCPLPCLKKSNEFLPALTKVNQIYWNGTEVLIGEIMNVADLMKYDASLSHNRKMGSILFKASESYCSEGAIDLDKILEIIGKTMKTDRAYIFFFRDGKKKMDNTKEWCDEGIEPQISFLQDLDSSIFPWWVRKLEKAEIINVEKVEEMPEEASAERQILLEQNIKSVLVVPIMSKGKDLIGFLGFDQTTYHRIWNNDDITALKIVSNLIGSFKDRENLISKLIEEKNKLYSTNLMLEKFTSSLYHDMQTPLTTIYTYLDILSGAIDNGEYGDVRFYLKKIKNSVSEISKKSLFLGNTIRKIENEGLSADEKG